MDYLLKKHRSPKTITCHLQTIRLFFDYLINDEGMPLTNPVTKVSIRLPRPLPRHLKDADVERLLAVIRDPRDRAMFILMLRCGLRVGGGLSSRRRCHRASSPAHICCKRERRQGPGCLSQR